MKSLIGNILILAALVAFPAYAAIDINTATQSELEAVKGLGPAKAKAIITYRESKGGFKTLDELDNVKGFGKVSIDKLKADLAVGSVKAKPSSRNAIAADCIPGNSSDCWIKWTPISRQ